MKNKPSFSSYLEKVKKTYKFKLRIAAELDSGCIDKAKKSVEQFGLVQFKKTKSLPIRTTYEFSDIGPREVDCFDVETEYPASSEQIRAAISGTGIAQLSFIRCYTEKEFELFLHNIAEKTVETVEPEKFQLIKDLEGGKFSIAGENTKKAETTNDIPQNTKSPIVGAKNA